MRQRLERPEGFDYQVLRSNDHWPEHRLRTLVTAGIIAWLQPESVLDPACGDGSLVTHALDVRTTKPIKHVYLNDISTPNIEALQVAAGLRLAMVGAKLSNLPINELLSVVNGQVDVIALTEILEHLDDPDATLRLAKLHGRHLVASSPIMRPRQVDDNPEHLWQFDREGYEEMLTGAGWRIQQFTFIEFSTQYDFGVWVCK
jgi:2-polyprenyl-3-methyl-5-hydroxy-6-metoxy-1,4-benzoquinol methylase